MIRGVLMVLAGVVLFQIHGRRTELFARGLMPAKPAPDPDVRAMPLEPPPPPPVQ
jgi:hypothetical protein